MKYPHFNKGIQFTTSSYPIIQSERTFIQTGLQVVDYGGKDGLYIHYVWTLSQT